MEETTALMSTLNIGDKVYLNHDSTVKMVITKIKDYDYGNGIVECAWFDTDNRLQRANFYSDCLTKYNR